jgi:hypothetical protein
MNSLVENLSSAELRALVILGTKKFLRALEYGSTLSDLEELRNETRAIADVLKAKEQQELRSQSGENRLRIVSRMPIVSEINYAANSSSSNASASASSSSK